MCLAGLDGEGSREGRGEGAADDCAEVWEDWDASLEGQESVLGVMVVDDSRERGGWENRLASVAPPLLVFCDLSMAADTGEGSTRGMESRLDQACQGSCDRLSLRAKSRDVGQGKS